MVGASAFPGGWGGRALPAVALAGKASARLSTGRPPCHNSQAQYSPPPSRTAGRGGRGRGGGIVGSRCSPRSAAAWMPWIAWQGAGAGLECSCPLETTRPISKCVLGGGVGGCPPRLGSTGDYCHEPALLGRRASQSSAYRFIDLSIYLFFFLSLAHIFTWPYPHT